MQKVKILVVKHGALGDVIQALDGFASLRAAYPHAHIAVMTAPTCAPLFSLMPWFDEVVVDCREKLFNFSAAFIIKRGYRRRRRRAAPPPPLSPFLPLPLSLLPASSSWPSCAP